MSSNQTLKDQIDFDTIHYNGFVFSAIKTKKLKEEPVYDEAGRNVKYMRLTITIESVVVPTDISYQDGKSSSDITANLTTYMDIVREKLNKPGKELILLDTGYGNLAINVATANRGTYDTSANKLFKDLEYGPKPQVLETQVLARDKAFKLVWQVVTAIPCCANDYEDTDVGSGLRDNIVAFEFSVSHNFTEEGLMVRSTEGSIEVPRHYVGDLGTKKDDFYRTAVEERIGWIASVTGIKRDSTWEWSNDKRVLSFSITDSEIPSDNPFYPGTVDMDITHETASSLLGGSTLAQGGAGFTRWRNVLSGNITLSPNTARHVAWWAFLDVFNKRVANLDQHEISQNSKDGQVNRMGSYMILNLRVKEHIHKRRIDFDLTWVATINLEKALSAQGFFLPSTDHSWDEHAAAATYRASNHKNRRAIITFRDNPEDFCDEDSQNPSQSTISPDDPPFPIESTFLQTTHKKPDQNFSYLDYRNELKTKEKTQTVQHQRTKKIDKEVNQDNSNNPNPQQDQGNIPSIKGADPDASIIQVRGPGTYMVTMQGYAIRAGSKPQPPVLLKVGDANAIRRDGDWVERVISPSLDYPVYLAMWKQTYLLDKKPSDVDLSGTTLVSDGDPGNYI